MKKFNYILKVMLLVLICGTCLVFSACDSVERDNPDDPKAVNYVPTYVWRTMANMNVNRLAFSASLFNGNIYVFGGYDNVGYNNSIEVYNPNTNSWTNKVTTLLQGTYYHTSVVVNDKIVLIGGYNGTNRNFVQEYDPVADSWISKSNAGFTARQQHCSVANGNYIYVFGGFDGTNNLNSLQMFSYSEGVGVGTWTDKTAMPTQKRDFAAVISGNYIYVFGGTTNGTSGFTTLERYNIAEDRWDKDTNNGGNLLPMPIARFGHAAAVVGDRIYLFGGKNITGYVSIIDIYSISNNTWTTGTNITTTRSNLSISVSGNKMYTFGGTSDGTTAIKTSEVYTPYYD